MNIAFSCARNSKDGLIHAEIEGPPALKDRHTICMSRCVEDIVEVEASIMVFSIVVFTILAGYGSNSVEFGHGRVGGEGGHRIPATVPLNHTK